MNIHLAKHNRFKLSILSLVLSISILGLPLIAAETPVFAENLEADKIKGCLVPNSDPNLAPLDKLVLNSQPLYRFNPETMAYDQNQLVHLFDPKLDNTAPVVQVPQNYSPSKFDFRSTWLATINNLTIPQTTDTISFKSVIDEYLDEMDKMNMNAVIFQIRPELDAWYLSKINPLSSYLNSGIQGQNNWEDKKFDPLDYILTASHARSMEFHAWFNPYRVTSKKITQLLPDIPAETLLAMPIEAQIGELAKAGILAPNNFAVLNPTEVYQFDEKFFLNPSSDKVINHVVETIQEVLDNYDVDAIHFDDYFYPYRVNVTTDGQNILKFFGDKNEDAADFAKVRKINSIYTDDNAGLEQWRRDNITKLIIAVKNTIDNHNDLNQKAVQFGISPFGIWEHKQINPAGSNTPLGSTQSYSKSIYADTKSWVENQYLDYMIPQLYWSFEKGAAPYGELASWWNELAYNNNDYPNKSTLIYLGHANYKHYHNSHIEKEWLNPEEIANQILFNQTLDSISGNVYFSLRELITPKSTEEKPEKLLAAQVSDQSAQLLKENYFKHKALVTSKPWLDQAYTHSVTEPYFIPQTDTKILNQFSWKDDPQNDTRYYVIYRGLGKATDIFLQPQYIFAKVPRNATGEYNFTDTDANNDTQYTYLISSVDRAQVESQFVEVRLSEADSKTFNIDCNIN